MTFVIVSGIAFCATFGASCASTTEAKHHADVTETSTLVNEEESMADQPETLTEIDAALDQRPWDLEVFARGVALLEAEQDWRELERFYRRELRRVVNLDDQDPSRALSTGHKFELWRDLGRVYEHRMRHPKSALAAYSAALSLLPDDAELAEKVAQLQALVDDAPQQ